VEPRKEEILYWSLITWCQYSVLLTPWSKVLFVKLTVTQLVKKFPTFYDTRKFITLFTTAHHWSLSQATCIQTTTSQPISLRSILILSPHIRLAHPFSLPTKILYKFPISSMRATCLVIIVLDLITLILFGEAYKSWSSSLCRLLQLPATFYLLGPNILLSTPFSNTLNLRSFHTKQWVKLEFWVFKKVYRDQTGRRKTRASPPPQWLLNILFSKTQTYFRCPGRSKQVIQIWTLWTIS
jgi:hypothetical protein